MSNLTYTAQAKLLRVLQEKEIHHLGGDKPIKVDVRVIVDSNVPLEEKVRKGEFREDLYHRLNEFNIWVPPLREREDDIFLLSEYFLDQANKEFSKKIKGLSHSAKELLKRYKWPGNIRELKNTIRKAALLADEIIYPEHLVPAIQIVSGVKTEATIPIKEEVKESNEELEKKLLVDALNQVGNNKKKAAKILGISRQALYYKMRKYELKIK